MQTQQRPITQPRSLLGARRGDAAASRQYVGFILSFGYFIKKDKKQEGK